ncbi:zinc-binding dehydrogenase [Parenemella sanctibonifatiensis]|uniref:Zinc-binding dehydrogenase n=1 Tax=Parenemella sanctibonifatiensis TaxID=2016505 RepID=A0A255ENQ8_9ACTN|nr:zinc-binding dehydrogenase [Parenemella sanctibonifatiensis]OYN91102.1 zinc-binding dehydrogenase [Parenemella sanctibonifatiensis]
MSQVSDLPTTQRAIVLTEHGEIDGLSVVSDHPVAELGPTEVLLRVRASSLNYHDIFTVRGMPGITIPMPVVPGLDVAGEIAAVGAEVADWQVGQVVVINPLREDFSLIGEVVDGGLAEYCLVDANQLIAIPAGVSPAQAAALPVAYGTAHRMVITQDAIHAGDTVLVLGASGGVGTAGVQLAKHLGARVVAAVGSDEKAQRMLELGADEVINYREQDFYQWTKEHLGKPSRSGYEGGFDVIINNTGGDTWHPTLRSTKRGGRILVCGATAGFDPTEDLRYIWSFELRVIGSNGFTTEDISALLQLVADGKIDPVLDSVVPLEEGITSLQRLADRDVIGKAVIAPAGVEAANAAVTEAAAR